MLKHSVGFAPARTWMGMERLFL